MLDYISAHWADALAIIGGLVTIASVIVKLTPTVKDDSILAAVVKFLDYFSVAYPKPTLK
jgi:hypothetical protein